MSGNRQQAAGAATRMSPDRAALAAVVGAVSSATRRHPREILGACRRRDLARARWLSLRILIDLTGASAALAGRLFGLHHSSVLHALKRLEEIEECDLLLATERRAIARAVLCGVPAPPVTSSSVVPARAAARPPYVPLRGPDGRFAAAAPANESAAAQRRWRRAASDRADRQFADAVARSAGCFD